jgi:hypothetical protein
MSSGRTVKFSVTWKGVKVAIRQKLDYNSNPILMVFINHPPDGSDSSPFTKAIPINLFTPESEQKAIEVVFQKVPDDATHLGFWLYAKDFFLSDRNHPSWNLQGLAYVPLDDHAPDKQIITLREMVSTSIAPNAYVPVADIQLNHLTVDIPLSSIRFPGTSGLQEYEESVRQELFNEDQEQNAPIVENKHSKQIATFKDSVVALPAPVSPMVRLPVPMWVFTLLTWMHSYDAIDEHAISHYLYLAWARLVHNTSKAYQQWDEPEWMQLACEAAILVPLAMEYRNDHVGNHAIEQFAWLGHHSVDTIRGAGFDCEDAAEHCLRVMLRMQHGRCPFPPLDNLLQEYEFFLAIVTLESDNKMRYHAVVMGFDKQWLINRVTNASSSSPSVLPKRRAILIEGTDYVTGHYGFQENTSAQRDVDHYLLNPLRDNTHFNVRVPSKALSTSRQYHHLIMACTPQWIRTEAQVGEITFCDDKGALGVPLTPLLEHNEEAWKNICVKVPSTRVPHQTLEEALRFLSYLPYYRPLPCVQTPLPQKDYALLPRGSIAWTQDRHVYEQAGTQLSLHNSQYDGAFSSSITPFPFTPVTQRIADNLEVYGFCFTPHDLPPL